MVDGTRNAGRWRAAASTILAVAGVLLLLVGVVLFWARDTLSSSDRFAGSVVEAVEQPVVSVRIVRAVVDDLIAQQPRLIAVRPLLELVTAAVIDSSPFRAILTRAAYDAHRTLFTSDRTIVLDISDAITVIIGGLRAYDPDLAASIPAGVEAGLLRVASQDGPTRLVQVADRLSVAALLAPPLALAALAGALRLARDRRRTLIGIGIGLAIGALVLSLGVRAGRGALVGRFEEPDTALAVGAVVGVFTAPLMTWLVVLSVAGVLLAAAASATVSLTDPRARLAELGRLATRMPDSTGGRLAYAGAVVTVGAVSLASPSFALAAVARMAGLLALYLGGAELLRLTGLVGSTDVAGDGRRGGPVVRFDPRPLAIAGVAVAAVVGGAALWLNRGDWRGERIAAAAIERCNGHAELCDRRLTEVAFATTHNSMAAARERGWFFPAHETGIPAQLRAGVRGFQIDAYYGFAGNDDVATDVSNIAVRRAAEATLDPEMIAAGQRLAASRAGVARSATREIFLCHGFCEVGAARFETVLGQMYGFLRANPHEVLILFIEDYVSPEEMEAAFIRTRMIDHVFIHKPGAEWPTLREMIERDERVLVLSENIGATPAPAWYHDGFALTQETAFAVRALADFDCAPNRGRPDSPLFQFNHWIARLPPLQSDAAIVNALDFLLARALRCKEERGLTPNLVAVDFYEVGDLLRVVDAINGVGPPAKKQ